MAYIAVILIEFVLFVFISFYLYTKWVYRHWARLNVPYGEPTFPVGTFGNPFTRKLDVGLHFKSYYDDFKGKGCRYGGLYSTCKPVLLLVDLELIKSVLMKDFQHFFDRVGFVKQKSNPLSGHLLNLEGKSWKNMRTKLTPTFTSGRMKMMFEALVNCSEHLKKKMDELADDETPVDIKDVLGCFTTDVIGSCAFGIECHSFDQKAAVFRRYGKKILETGFTRNAAVLFTLVFPKLADFLGVSTVDQDTVNFFLGTVKDAIEHRKKNNVVRKDFLQLLIDLKHQTEEEGGNLTIEDIAAQCFVFFVAGFETSSTTMSFALYELARHKAMQANVRKEVEEVLEKHEGNITYEAIQEMKYLDQVIKETLRKYPPVSILSRKCTIDYKIPDSNLTLKKREWVFIPVMALHRDPEYFPEPEDFNPDRFGDDVKHKIPHGAYLPFGDGPRNCIGLRFGLMQSKVGLMTLLRKYEFSVHPKTAEPLKFHRKSFILAAEDGIWLRAKNIK